MVKRKIDENPTSNLVIKMSEVSTHHMFLTNLESTNSEF